MVDKIKVAISSFVITTLENDAYRYSFVKNNKANKNALLNKLIPILMELRQEKRERLVQILKYDYNRSDADNVCDAVNSVVDKIYYYDEELDVLDDYLWIRPSKENISVFDEIKSSEIHITSQTISEFIRGLLNEYSRLPQYKREELVYKREYDVFKQGYFDNRVVYFTDSNDNRRYKVFPLAYYYEHLYEQVDYCVFYDIKNNKIRSVRLSDIKNAYMIKEKFYPSDKIINKQKEYTDKLDFESEVIVGELV